MALDRETVARILRTARENRGLSQHAVSKRLRVSRTLIAQIELGNRPVTDEELLQFATLYGQTLVELKGTEVSEDDDPVTAALLKVAPELATGDMQQQIHAVLGSLMEASHLEQLLERPRRTGPLSYVAPPPRTPAEAIALGAGIGERERQRLRVAEGAIADIADLVAGQGIHVFALDLPDRMSQVFVQHPSVGCVVVVNAKHDVERQRFAIVHGYAHAVIESAGTIRVCTHANAKELNERRADAFAGAFLLPASVVLNAVRGLGKGQPSRQVQWVFDAAKEQAVRAEERSTPGSQTMTYVDVVRIAGRFGAGYRLTVSRLLGLGLISETDSARLLRSKFVELAREWSILFGSETARARSPHKVAVLSDLNAERAHMAVEAYRRGLLTRADLATEALSLQVPGLSEPKLIAFAEAAR